jgi:ATP-binding cassette subfamily B protein
MNSALPSNRPEARWKRTTELMATLIKMYRLLWIVSPFRLLCTFACRILLAVHSVIHIYILSMLVNAVTQVITAGHPVTETGRIILLQVGLSVAAAGIRSLDGIVMSTLKMKMQFHIEDSMAQQSSRLPLVHFDRPDYYDSFHRATASQNSLILIDNSFNIMQSFLTVTGYFIIVASFHWLLAAGLLLFVAPSLIVNMKIGQKRFFQMVFQTPVARKAHYMFNLLVGREAAKEVRLFGLAPYLIEKWRSLFWQNAKQQIQLERKGTMMNWGVESFNSVIGGALVIGLAWLSTKGRLTLGQYVALTDAFSSANNQLLSISSNMALMYQNVLFARELFAYLELPEEEQPAVTLQLADRIEHGIEAEGLVFHYPGQSEPVLKNLSFLIRPGQKIAIVGDNGAGKSTLAKCLLGLYSPSEGTIRLDGTDIQTIDRIELRKKITAVFQDFVRYQLTVRENIGFGSVNRLTDNGWLEAAAAKSGANEFIEGLQDGVDSWLGAMFDGGRELSQGQWQKIAISRAYFRDAEVVVLDEPTASMDPMTEASVYENFLRMAEGKTTLLISHRLGICKAVDLIFVMKKGQLVEQGTHEELLRQGGEYAQMYQIQSKWYDS